MKNRIIIDIPTDVKEIMQVIKEYGAESYIVGGCVRDSILGRTPHDWDICSPVPVCELQAFFEEKGYKVIPTGLKHGTITVNLNGNNYEITMYRKDGVYSDGRHPDNVEFTSDLIYDLERRDFTINAMAYNEEKGLIDPFGGLNDIRDKTIRCVGNPDDRFREDALRILRAWRFSVQLNFIIELHTFRSAKRLQENIKNVSTERIRDEFVKALSGNCKVFSLMTGGFSWMECIAPGWEQAPYNESGLRVYENLRPEADLVTRLAALLSHKLPEEVYQILTDLKFDTKTKENVEQLSTYLDWEISVNKITVKKYLTVLGTDQFDRLLLIKEAGIKGNFWLREQYKKIGLIKLDEIRFLKNYILKQRDCLTLKDLAVNGEDVMEVAGIEKGPKVGRILNTLLDDVISEELVNDRDFLLKYLYTDIRGKYKTGVTINEGGEFHEDILPC